MYHVAIDLGGRESQVCIRQPDASIAFEQKMPTGLLGEWLASLPPSRVVMETCAEAFRLADQALACGHQARVVPSILVRQLGVGARRTKTDRRDAQILSEVSCRVDVPSVHIRSEASREMKSKCAARAEMVEARTKLINNVCGYLRTHHVRLRHGEVSTFSKRVRTALEISDGSTPGFIDRLLGLIDAISEQVDVATEELTELVNKDERCQLMMTCPGVGVITAARFVSVIDDVSRFPSAHAVESYLGLVPGENSSSTRVRRLGITKAGPSDMRKLLVQACWAAWTHYPSEPLVRWAARVAERRGRRVAIVAMARKMAGMLFAMWRDNAPYDASRCCRV